MQTSKEPAGAGVQGKNLTKLFTYKLNIDNYHYNINPICLNFILSHNGIMWKQQKWIPLQMNFKYQVSDFRFRV